MSIQSLDRAFDILELIANQSSPVPLKNIAEEMGLSVSTVHNLVRTMVNRGYVEHVSARGGFTLGNQLVELAANVPSHLQITELVRPFVLQLYNQSEKESTYFSTFRKDVISPEIYIPSSYALSVTLGADTLDKLHTSSQGKVFLAYMTESRREKYIRTHSLDRLGPNTIVDPESLRHEIVRVKELGYALNEDETELGASGIAAPLLQEDGRLLGVFAIGLPSVRMTEKKQRLISLIKGIAEDSRRHLMMNRPV
ncbi:IclR family transcriptional regulator [Paenibacillus roseipurpureus]|uniref:Glycerol operon regulatory protein n=1 Tax=Paenibacillus roseopurpureus TaxID=2918901 RepID=A0AA96LKL8_9BACL|nr:IclR family transcriptional regulator [Paenibacillus sp. MBLB1832]WNR43500.1 IclR family transcriptional regulator [Paenibacillus sp. MBLB1832]